MSQRHQSKSLVREYSDIFSTRPGLTHLITADIELTDSVPIESRPYKHSPRQDLLINKEIDKMLSEGVIERGESEYAPPVILVEVQGKDPRLCIDYRKLNDVTKTHYFPPPRTKKQVRAILGMIGYYRKFLKDFSSIVAPLTDLLKGKIKQGYIVWNNDCERSLGKIKAVLSTQPVLRAPKFDEQFILQCDASQEGIGACLSQKDADGQDHPVLYLSKKFSNAERNYSTSEQECLGIIYSVQKLRYYLDNGRPFLIQTDHNPLTWLKTTASKNARLHRWALILQEFNFEIEHRAGKSHANADFLSRV